MKIFIVKNYNYHFVKYNDFGANQLIFYNNYIKKQIKDSTFTTIWDLNNSDYYIYIDKYYISNNTKKFDFLGLEEYWETINKKGISDN